MTRQADCVVIGAGLLGLSAARALADRGREVTVLEQAEVGHLAGGSHGSCRIFRLGYPDPGYVSLAREAARLWAAAQARSGAAFLLPAPQLTFGERREAVHAAMLAAGAPCELLAAGAVAERFPGLSVPGPALLEPGSAVIAASLVLRDLAAGCPGLRTGARVTALRDDGRQVTVSTSAGPFTAPVVIVTAGPWTSGLLRPAGLRVPSSPILERVGYLAAAAGQPGAAGLPIFVCHGRQSPYGLPVPGEPLYKVGIHQSGLPTDPDHQDLPGTRDSSGSAGEAGALAGLARRYLPGLDPEPVRVERCVYDNSPDEDFIIDRIGNVVIGSGTSGHGFKFGPLLGEWLAGLAAGEPGAARPPDRFALGRFG
ncbi:MAG TPA: FAD-dependent oxidoreductase [Streptosporangiaceae bacterium]